MAELTPIGPVDVSVPPDPSMSRVVRLAASGVASLAGFSVDEVEDITIAVSEVFIALIEHGDGDRVALEFVVDQSAFNVRGRTLVEKFDIEHPDLVLCRTVLAGVCTDHGIYLVDDHAHIWASVRHAAVG